MLTKETIYETLRTVPDPELGLSIVDLGLVYDVTITDGQVNVLMTLTTMGCPLFSLISEPIKHEVKKLPGVVDVNVELTFDPPWSIEKLSEEAKGQLGMI